MDVATDTLIIGAGPYGLSLASHLREAGVEHRLLGDPMSAWRAMPKGMHLRSAPGASSLSDPAGALTLEAFQAERGSGPEVPLSLETFVAYGDWFRERSGVEAEKRFVATLERDGDAFAARLEDGEVIHARRVVVAAGTQAFRWVPPEFEALPADRVTHAGDHDDLSIFSGKRLLVMGRGQSGIECAALAQAAGASVTVLLRGEGVRWLTRSAWLHSAPLLSTLLYSPTDVGPAGLSRVVSVPSAFRMLPSATRQKASRRCSRPAAAAWLTEPTAEVRFETGLDIRAITASDDGVRVERAGGPAIEGDHLLLATGYLVDVARYGFISPDLLRAIRRVNGYPVLGSGYTSSVPRLHFLGWPAIWSYGPLMRHVSGVPYASRSVTRAARGRGAGLARLAQRRQYHFDADSYVSQVSANVPHYRELQAAVGEATRDLRPPRKVLDLGIGTGETAAAVLDVHPSARVCGVDASPQMLELARRRLAGENIEDLVVGKLEDPLPPGEFDLVVSSLAVHHLSARKKRELFTRIHHGLRPGSCFVLGDVVRPAKPEDAVTPTSRRHDRPEDAGELERWLAEAGFEVTQPWARRDLVVFRAVKPERTEEPAPT